MPKYFGGSSFRSGPDFLTQELATVLSGTKRFEFKPLFTVVYASLCAAKRASGGEEMVRLRVYEKLQALVYKGMVGKVVTSGVKEYFGLASLAEMLPVLPLAEFLPVLPLTEGVGL